MYVYAHVYVCMCMLQAQALAAAEDAGELCEGRPGLPCTRQSPFQPAPTNPLQDTAKPQGWDGSTSGKVYERKGKNDTEVVRIEGGKSEKQPCEMGTGGKRVKEQVFPKEWKKPWKT